MFSKLFRPAAMSFGTCSSVATIPTNMEVAEETGISKDVSNIVIPLGATMHMDGSAMSAIIKVAFLFGMFGQDFTTGRAILAIIVAVFSSVAMSGIPGGGGTGELVLCSIFFPDHLAVAFPIALALGNLVDPPATMVNSAGDYVVSFIVSRYVDGKDWLQKRLAGKKGSGCFRASITTRISRRCAPFFGHTGVCVLTQTAAPHNFICEPNYAVLPLKIFRFSYFFPFCVFVLFYLFGTISPNSTGRNRQNQ